MLHLVAGGDANEDAAFVSTLLAFEPRIDIAQLAARALLPDAQIASALGVLASSGQVGFDLAAGAYFHRPLPVQAGLLDTLHPRLAEARKLVAGGGVRREGEGSTRCNRRSSATGSRWAPSPRKTVAPAPGTPSIKARAGRASTRWRCACFLIPSMRLEPEHDLEPDRTPRGSEAAGGGDAADIAPFARAGRRGRGRARRAGQGLAAIAPVQRGGADAPGLLCAGRIGQTKLVAETLAPADMERKREYGARHGEMTPAVIEAAAGRDATWRAFVELLAEQYWWGEHLAWPVCHALVRLDGDAPLSAAYLRCFVRQVSAVGADGQLDADHGKLMAAHLRAHPGGSGVNSGPCSGSRAWAPITSSSSAPAGRTRPSWRCARKSRRSASGCWSSRGSAAARFFSEGIAWYCACIAWPIRPRTGRRQPARVSRRAGHGAAVGLAQDMLKRAVGLLDADAMIDAGAAVLTRAEKKLVKAQLGLFAALRTDAGQRNRLSRIVGEALEGMPLDLAPLARKLMDSSDETQRAATDGEMGARKRGGRQSRYRRRVANRCRICPTTRSPSSMTRNCMP